MAVMFFTKTNALHIFSKKHAFYKFLKTKGINWRKHLSKQLLPDNAIYVIVNNTMFIIEVKTQNVNGSVDKNYRLVILKRSNIKNFFRN